jgi:hypothetical protein
MHFPCSRHSQWNNFNYFFQGTCHNHPKSTTKTSNSYHNSLMNFDYQKQTHPPYITYIHKCIFSYSHKSYTNILTLFTRNYQ